jgi:anti-anti-sigma regulatory factor
MPISSVSSIAAPDFNFDVSEEDAALILRLRGTADMAVADKLAKGLEQSHAEAVQSKFKLVCVDLQAVYFVNSTCLKNFVTLVMRAKESGYKVRFLLNPRLSWQRRAVDPIERLAPTTVSVENGTG